MVTKMTSEATPVVLVADDEPSMLALVGQHIKTMGYKVLEASDGEQAWALAQEHLPDLVILDVMMPGMSGWEVCRKIREDIALAHTYGDVVPNGVARIHAHLVRDFVCDLGIGVGAVGIGFGGHN